LFQPGFWGVLLDEFAGGDLVELAETFGEVGGAAEAAEAGGLGAGMALAEELGGFFEAVVTDQFGRAEVGERFYFAVETGPMGLNFVAMANEIEDLFGIKADVVPKRSIKPAYLPFVEKDILYV